MSALSLFIYASLACFVLGLVIFPLARRIGLVDTPQGRKQHSGAVPLVGGVCILIVLLVGTFMQSAMDAPLMAALILLTALGVLDDKYDIPALWKLGAQVFAALLVCLGGDVVVQSLGTLPSGDELLLGPFALPFTILALVGLINAMNMVDGLDGLAAGLALLALAHLVIAMQLIGKPVDPVNLTQTLIICGALVGFLVLNLGLVPQRKIFLGDAGSMLLGLFIGVQLIEASQLQPLIDTLPTSLVPWVVALPVIDTLRLIFSRLKQGRSPLSPDRTHMHHILLDRGLSPRLTLIAMLAFSDILFWGGYFASRVSGMVSGTALIASTALLIFSISRR